MDDCRDKLAEFIRRVNRLESQARWCKGGAIGTAVVAITVLLVGADRPKGTTLEASRFILNGEDGKPRATLENTPEGPRLALWARNGSIRAALALGKDDNPTLLLQGSESSKQLILALTENEQGLVMTDREVSRLAITTNKDGDPLVVLKDREGRPRVLLSGLAKHAGLTVYDLDHKERLSLSLTADGARVELRDGGGKVLFAQPTGKQ